MMKNPIALVACALLFSSLAVMASPTGYGPDSCCFRFITVPLPKANVASYKYTDNMCPMNGVLITMASGKKFCAKPSMGWVKNIIKYKDSQIKV